MARPSSVIVRMRYALQSPVVLPSEHVAGEVMEPYWYGPTSSDSQQYGYYTYGVSLVTSGNVQGPHLAHAQTDRGICTESKKFVYSLRIINPKRKSLFEVKKFTSESRYQFPAELRSCIKEEFSDDCS